jgi:hypothetical protein
VTVTTDGYMLSSNDGYQAHMETGISPQHYVLSPGNKPVHEGPLAEGVVWQLAGLTEGPNLPVG